MSRFIGLISDVALSEALTILRFDSFDLSTFQAMPIWSSWRAAKITLETVMSTAPKALHR